MLCCLYWWVDSLSENESFITYSSVPYHMSLNSPTQQTSSVGSYNIPLSRSAVLKIIQEHCLKVSDIIQIDRYIDIRCCVWLCNELSMSFKSMQEKYLS